MFLVIGYTLFVLVSGVAIGATLVRDLIDGVLSKPQETKPAQLPRMWVDHLAHLNVPAVHRKRQRINIIDV